MADAALAAASASTAEPFSVRGFVARMRSVDAAKCHPFGGGCGEGEGEPPPPLPPMEPPPRARWWVHELVVVRAQLSVCDRGGNAAAAAGGGLRKGIKRKGSRSGAAAERAKKRRRVLQFRSMLKNKEKTSKPPSTPRLHQLMSHTGLSRKQNSSICSRREFAVRKEMEEARDHLLHHENSLTHELIERMDGSNDMRGSLSRRKEAHSLVNEQSVKVDGTNNCPVNTSWEVGRHASGGKDDIFGDLPLLKSSQVIFQTRRDELPIVIEESFITDQSDPDTEPEDVSLKLMNPFDITGQTSPLDDLVKIEGTLDKETICIPYNGAARSSALSAGIDCVPNRKSISMAKTHGDMHLKYSDGLDLSSYSDLRSKCSSNKPTHLCFDTNTNCSPGKNNPATSSATTALRDACAVVSTEKQDSWYSKVHPTCSPANIGLAFMKLPGLERMEISSCNVKTDENRKLMNERSLDIVRCQKQQLASSMTNSMQGQKNMDLCHSQNGKAILDSYVRQNLPHQQQPTMRLMGKTVSVCKRSKDHSASNMRRVCSDNFITEATPLTAIPCQLPQKRSSPWQDLVVPRSHLNDSSNFLARIPSNTFSRQKATFNCVNNQRLQPINSVSSTAKDCTWNFGSQSVHPAERNKVSMVTASSETRHVELHQPPHMASISWNQNSQFTTSASCRGGDDSNFVGPARNQSSPIQQGLLKSNVKEKYKRSTVLCYDDRSVPISQPSGSCPSSGTKLPSVSIVSFVEYSNNSLSRYPSSGSCPSHTTSLANISVSASGRTYTDSPTSTGGRMGAGFSNKINNRPDCIDNAINNVSQAPSKRQLLTDRHDFTFMGSNMTNHSLGWSLNDAVGPQILDFRNNVAGDDVQVWRTEHNNPRVSSGPVLAVETRWRGGLVAEAKTMLKPGQGLNDQSKVLYPATFSVKNGVNSVVL